MESSLAFLIDTALRIATTTELVLLSFLLLVNGGGDRIYRAASVLFITVAGYMLAPLALYQTPFPLLGYSCVLLAVLVPTGFWYLAYALFRDNQHFPIYSFPLAALTGVLGIIGFDSGPDTALNWLDWLSQGAKMLWVVAAFVILLVDWRHDLVESRRRLRQQLVLCTGLYLAAVMVVELFLGGARPALVELLNVCLLFVLITALTLHFLSLDAGNIFARINAPAPLDPGTEQSLLAQQVMQLMEEERAYATDGLTLDSLARQLDTQPHRLRAVINGELGQRNFNAFINRHRVLEVANRLGQPEYRDTALLTLALDAGFRSLAPFNRSFREQFGQTPSAYRSQVKSS